MADDRPLVPVIVGATGVGKTAVVAALASKFPVGVIAADARQVYRGLDIGTAKPAAAERARVRHWGVDILDVGTPYSAGQFARDAAAWVEEARTLRLQPVVVGGTGFYIRALTAGLFEEPALEESRVRRLRGWARDIPGDRLMGWAARLDRAFAAGGAQRATRSIEIALLTGRPLGWWQQHGRRPGAVRPWFVHLVMPRDALYARLLERARGMVAEGLLEETARVVEQGWSSNDPGLDAIGYRQAIDVLEGRLDRDSLATAIAQTSRQYAKRQETWFRHQLAGGPVQQLDARVDAKETAAALAEAWRLAEVS